MKVIKKPLTELRRPDRNVRMHTDKQLKEFRRSVEMFGQIRPIVVDEDGVILAGNGLYETLLSLGRTEADCYVVSGLTEAEKKKLMLADNRVFDLGVDDLAALDAFILELKDDLDIPGYEEDLLRAMVMEADEASDALLEYGTIEPEQAAAITETREKYAAREEAAAAQAEEVAPAQSGTASSAEPAKRFTPITPSASGREVRQMADADLFAPLSSLQWVDREQLKPNDYNPNKVNRENLKLLVQSIMTNGWTLPIVVRPDYTIIDGFHRWTVAGEEPLHTMLKGKVPVVIVRHDDATEDIYGTVTHNRARGTHLLEPMKAIVKRLLDEGKSVQEIGKQLGMKPEEVFRLSDFSRDDFLGMMTKGVKGYSHAELLTKL